MKELFDKFGTEINEDAVDKSVEEIVAESKSFLQKEKLVKAFGLIDLTSLNPQDNYAKIASMCKKVNSLSGHYQQLPNVAAICVYPALVEIVKKELTVPKVKIASVSAGFPASQTFIDVKIAETKKAVDCGADEIDIVISVGRFLENNYTKVFDEIAALKDATGEKHLKVILETGALQSYENIRKASLIAMKAGADFIKTSTGKIQPAATLQAVYIMSVAIMDYYKETGIKTGLKPAGGISTSKQVIEYLSVIDNVLGDDWITPEYFRFGASSLANNIITDVCGASAIPYF